MSKQVRCPLRRTNKAASNMKTIKLPKMLKYEYFSNIHILAQMYFVTEEHQLSILLKSFINMLKFSYVF